MTAFDYWEGPMKFTNSFRFAPIVPATASTANGVASIVIKNDKSVSGSEHKGGEIRAQFKP
jgi:hypothetical protein